MTAQAAAATALAAYTFFLVLAFGLRSIVQLRRTGSTGFVGISGRPGSTEWCAGMLFVVALVAGGAAPVAQLAGALVPYAALNLPSLQVVGIVLYLIGVGGTLWAQFAMGDSWRIGVDAAERTTLVVSGPFRFVRNPIFTGMGIATLGLALLVPNALSLTALVVLVLALEVHVHLVEEPHLMRQHGDSYRRYASATGRFLPGIGLRIAPRHER